MIGETIGNFRLVGRLGRGGMGEVYLGEQTSIGTKVAVKVLSEIVSSDSEHLQRFFNEARAVSKIQHAGIVKIFDVGIHSSGHAYLVMEFLDGESLAARLRRVGRLPVAEIADIGKQIASVLAATHAAGVTHRDLKPDNVFCVPDRELASGERVKVLDFGIAKLSGTLANVSPQTVGAMGTPAYMAPEQWGDASKVDWRADLYSLGCLAFEMACGRPPFAASNIAEACGKHLNETPPKPSDLVAAVPRELDALIADLLEKKPGARPASAAVVARRFEALAGVAGTIPASSLPRRADPMGATMASEERVAAVARTVAVTPRPVKRRARWPWVVLALLAAGGGAAAYVLIHRGTPRDDAAALGPANADWCKLAAAPLLDGSSDRAVLPRYHFTPGQTAEVNMTTQTQHSVIQRGVRDDHDVTLTLEGTVVWLAAEGDRFSASWKLSNLEITKLQRGGTRDESHYETARWSFDTKETPEGYGPFRALQGAEILVTIDARGAILDSNLEELADQLARGGADPEVRALFAPAHVFRLMFPRLPAKPVKIGDTWKGAALDEPLGREGTQSSPMQMRLLAVSADGNQLLIGVAPELRIDVTGKVRMIGKDGRVAMWAQLDQTRHQIVAGAFRACTDLKIDTDAGTRNIGTQLTYSYDAVTSVAAPAPPPPPAVDAAVAAAPDAAVAPDAATEPDAVVAPDAGVDDGEPPLVEPSGAIGDALRAAKDRLAACVTGGGGRLTVRMRVGSDGRVRSASATGLSGKENQCLGEVIRTLVIERKPGAPPFSVTVPIVVRAR